MASSRPPVFSLDRPTPSSRPSCLPHPSSRQVTRRGTEIAVCRMSILCRMRILGIPPKVSRQKRSRRRIDSRDHCIRYDTLYIHALMTLYDHLVLAH